MSTVTIDGPSASGKSTVARLVSERLGLPLLETGLVYRAFAYASLKTGITDPEELFKLPLKVELKVGRTVVLLNGRELPEEELKSELVGKRASELAALPEFRERINALFRSLLRGRPAVVEGRDAGTHVVPEAPFKFFVTASTEERAKRRYLQLKEMGKEVSYEEVLKAIKERDERDAKRPKYPFRPAPDAVVLDTTDRTPEEVADFIVSRVRASARRS
ncbi:MAG: (d)CMP kinase [Aquificae bacterium]|nr:(d)CMP kinase [Aquificota bacterium]